MRSLFVFGFLTWIAATASSLTDEKADKILNTFMNVTSQVAAGYETVKQKSIDGYEEIQKYQKFSQQQYLSIQQPSPVLAQLVTESSCVHRAQLMTQLQNEYGETVSLVGKNTDGRVVEVMHSNNGTFSIVSTDTNGMACLLASGQTGSNDFSGSLAMLTQM
jgi:hypothetical protein